MRRWNSPPGRESLPVPTGARSIPGSSFAECRELIAKPGLECPDGIHRNTVLFALFGQGELLDFMNTILIVGSGGREHALLKALLRSDRPLCIHSYPGNPGMERDGCMRVDATYESWDGLAEWAQQNGVDLTIVGPEQPLVDGIVDAFHARGLTVFGPTRAAAEIEGSKVFSKNLMKKYGIPTADFATFTDKESALAYLAEVGAPIVVKAGGLAAGKGAVVCDTMEEAENTIADMLERHVFGEAGSTIVLEEKMVGEEASVFALTDGKDYKLLPVSQDHKAAYDGDLGPNTGGMGAYAPAPVVSPDLLKRIEDEIVKPTLKAMVEEDRPYRGLLYVGVMVTDSGPKVVEYNCRFGDPETQAVLPLVECDWYQVFEACAKGDLRNVSWSVRNQSCAAVVLASGGYPGSYEKGKLIDGAEITERNKGNVDIYHAGTALDGGGNLVTNGGRVLAVSAWSDSLREAIRIAYENVENVHFEGRMFRRDIGAKGLVRTEGI